MAGRWLSNGVKNMNVNSNISLKNLKINWRRHVYKIIGILIAAALIFMIFRSLGFLAGQISAIFQIERPSSADLIKFDIQNFEKIKDRLK